MIENEVLDDLLQRRWVHRFQEQNLSGLTCIAAGLNNIVALGDKKGRIHVYEVRNLKFSYKAFLLDF